MSRILTALAVVCIWAAILSPLVMLGGCTDRRENMQVDPKAFQFWVVPF